MTLKDWSFQKCVVHNKFDIYNFTYFNLISKIIAILYAVREAQAV
jgi:hypothetical protein